MECGQVAPFFLNSILHLNLKKLTNQLTGALSKYHNRPYVVFYDRYHPLMERIHNNAGTVPTPDQSCIDTLLGHDRFSAKLASGAFYLLEDWARRGEYITLKKQKMS